MPTVFWVDNMCVLNPSNRSNTGALVDLLNDTGSERPTLMATIIIYNVPNRDCGSATSNGEIFSLKRAK